MTEPIWTGYDEASKEAGAERTVMVARLADLTIHLSLDMTRFVAGLDSTRDAFRKFNAVLVRWDLVRRRQAARLLMHAGPDRGPRRRKHPAIRRRRP